ncbi:MerR HTH family regulatory protein [Paracoccus isoporae]|uniref:MerR HTH family regulatory protein n=1 Tax=Paracoccus isoporae TaxID=591205 RepID=A0A1G6WVM2_9RHOB|nr:MerR family transcriptional regulator [Paracoccus isoporae]SDD69136.1 MerR HTH family regulatory protein [Paracoccus isoporae]
MKKAADAFRSIGEVSQLVGVAPHVLRYWESQFPLFSPVKRRDGRRYYRPDDIRMAAGLCALLREDGMSIRGAKSQMATDRGAAVKARGAARLGGDFATGAEAQTGDSGKMRKPGKGSAPETRQKAAAKADTEMPVSRKGQTVPRPRKDNQLTDSLPLFPELGARTADAATDGSPSAAPTERSDHPAPATRRTGGPEGADGAWLGRLLRISAALHAVSDLPAGSAQVARDHIRQARQTLSA